jgi:hypothetical protein
MASIVLANVLSCADPANDHHPAVSSLAMHSGPWSIRYQHYIWSVNMLHDCLLYVFIVLVLVIAFPFWCFSLFSILNAVLMLFEYSYYILSLFFVLVDFVHVHS